MKTFTVLLVITSLTLTSLGRSFEPYRPNGWYYITSGAQDSLSVEPIVTTKDFVSIRLDSFMSERTGKMAYQIVGRVNDQSIKIWADATEQSIGKHIGFVCNNKVVCNPLVNARIESGNFAISGSILIGRFQRKGISWLCLLQLNKPFDCMHGLRSIPCGSCRDRLHRQTLGAWFPKKWCR